MTQMTSNQPYLLRAFFDWIVDNNLTPYIVVDATNELVEVPLEFVKDGQIVLNISPSACVNFYLDTDGLSFQARFGGQPRRISMPCHAVLAIYARENGAGTVFAAEPVEESTDSASSISEVKTDAEVPPQVPPKPTGKPNLKVVK
ncbi:ClpXP protease specificity-enhancing factor [Aestuariibacter sp. GS-14]|uniref:ClpXP protease specificity-enhancing factor n=1 Tax=Alteromonadaceae TaxID=72275 RepID=UPI0011280998|nr:ClpXP protease specificity-enhancing factor [Aestuariibacter sp. GS-14]TPV57777.1 ClpXP protease specificity-enhancing factor [Aestuariibacter sp. GS-14]